MVQVVVVEAVRSTFVVLITYSAVDAKKISVLQVVAVVAEVVVVEMFQAARSLRRKHQRHLTHAPAHQAQLLSVCRSLKCRKNRCHTTGHRIIRGG
jgi:hypothetical protein